MEPIEGNNTLTVASACGNNVTTLFWVAADRAGAVHVSDSA